MDNVIELFPGCLSKETDEQIIQSMAAQTAEFCNMAGSTLSKTRYEDLSFLRSKGLKYNYDLNGIQDVIECLENLDVRIRSLHAQANKIVFDTIEIHKDLVMITDICQRMNEPPAA